MSKLQGISVKLPLHYSTEDGPYQLNKNLGSVIKQNFKNLLLTSPGERVMLPEFGVGLRQLLFEPIGPRVYERISTRIRTQTQRFLPFINIENIRFVNADNSASTQDNEVKILVSYNIGSIDTNDTLTISQTND